MKKSPKSVFYVVGKVLYRRGSSVLPEPHSRAYLVKGVTHGGVSANWNTVLFNRSQEQPGKKRLQHIYIYIYICQLHHDGGLNREVVLWRPGDDIAPGGGAHGLLLFQ